MSAQCVVHTPDGRCLGHPPAEDERYPAICQRHLDELFGPLIESKARILASQMALQNRPRPTPRPPHQPVRPLLRKGAHLNAEDMRVLNLLCGAT
jgi:hypothetical protein